MVRFSCFLIFLLIGEAYAQTLLQCTGTDMPYSEPKFIEMTPDRLTPFFINHIGRHGASYPTSRNSVYFLSDILQEAKERNQLSPRGSELFFLTLRIKDQFDGHSGELSILGVTEQQNMAKRIYSLYPDLWNKSRALLAISDTTPRCINSMKAFCDEVSRQDPYIEIKQNSGSQYDATLRFFDKDSLYQAYQKSGLWLDVYNAYRDSMIPAEIADSLFTDSLTDLSLKRRIVSSLFEMLSDLPAVGIDNSFGEYFTYPQSVDLWKIENQKQYLLRSVSPAGEMLPVKIAAPLLQDFITIADSVIENKMNSSAVLRFAQAEAIIPFAALMQIKIASDVVSVPDSVFSYWRDYRIAPMSANIQWVFFRDKQNAVWVKFLLNERPVLLTLTTPDPPYYRWDDVKLFFRNILSPQ